MDKILTDYLDRFEEKMRIALLKTATERGHLNGKLLESDDITEYWRSIEANYMADAVPEIAQYPTVSVAWALYLGMAVAYCWDMDWQTYCKTPYEGYYGTDGFDNMDDHIVRDILGLAPDSDEAKRLVSLVQTLAQQTVDAIRHEQIEPQSKMAFYTFSRACNAMFAIGAAITLHRQGYNFEKM